MPLNIYKQFLNTVSANGILKREQVNDITSWIDASNVYGSSDAELAALRDGTTRKALFVTKSLICCHVT